MGDCLIKNIGDLKFFGNFKGRLIAAAVAIILSVGISAAVFAFYDDSEPRSAAVMRVPAVEVKLNGASYGFVADTAAAQSIPDLVGRDVYGEVDTSTFEFCEAFVLPSSITDCETIASSIKNEDIGVISAFGVYIDGELKAVSLSRDELDLMLEELTVGLTADGAELVGVVNNTVLTEIETTNDFLEANRVNREALKNGDYGIEITTKKTVTYESKISYKTEKKYDDEKTTDYSKVLQEGKNGLKKVTDEVTYVNGEKASSKTLSSTVLSEAVNKIVEVGTKTNNNYHNGYPLVRYVYDSSKATMTFPLPITDRAYITSYWGDGRGHKGLDIASPKGTDVYAALDGTVTYSGWQNGYGNIVIIQHDDKTATAYAHNSKLIAKKGDKVTAGQVIAEVGSTGRSTGNHLHFEVRINGTKVDAAPYIGIEVK